VLPRARGSSSIWLRIDDSRILLDSCFVTQVVRLTASTRPDPSQLLRQAEIISALTSQRNYLIQQIEEERIRWESEKDSWARAAEALIAQRNKDGHSAAKDAVSCFPLTAYIKLDP